jgi:hypothetical protein
MNGRILFRTGLIPASAPSVSFIVLDDLNDRIPLPDFDKHDMT